MSRKVQNYSPICLKLGKRKKEIYEAAAKSIGHKFCRFSEILLWLFLFRSGIRIFIPLIFAFLEPYVPVAAAVNLPPLHIPPPGYPPGKRIALDELFTSLATWSQEWLNDLFKIDQ